MREFGRELGEVLRKRREELGVSLEDVQAATKIRKRYLQAIEEGDWSVLPGDVYARGFVRAYADYLGLNGTALLEEYDHGDAAPEAGNQSSAGNEEPQPEVTVRPERITDEMSPAGTRPRRKSRKSLPPTSRRIGWAWSEYGAQALTVAAILLVLGGGWYWLSAANRHAAPGPGAGASGGATGAGLNGSAVNVAGQNGIAGTGNVPAQNSVNANGTSNATTPGAPATTVTEQPRRGSVQIYVVSTPASSFTVQLQAQSGDCWVAVTADGRVVDGNDTVHRGESRNWQAAQTLDIRAGDAAAVTVTVDGQPVHVPPVPGPLHLKFVRST
jgi:transcriptional regulator with XRE-family HTH domain